MGHRKPFSEFLFEFIIEEVFNPNATSPPYDILIASTIANIFLHFYQINNNTVSIYICESKDERQSIRMNKFDRWFASFNDNSFIKVNECITDSNNISYPISLIIKKTNPNRLEITEEFFRLADGYNTGK